MGISRYLNICTLFIVLMCLYNLQGLNPQIGNLSQIFQLLYLLIAFYCFVKVNIAFSIPPLMKGLNILLMMFIIYGSLHILLEKSVLIPGTSIHIPTYVYLQRILRSLLPIYAFYYFTKKGYITYKYLYYVFFLFFVVAILEFNAAYVKRFGEAMQGEISMTNNVGYAVLALMPGLILYNKKLMVKYIGLSVILAFVFMSTKRGAILIAVVGMLFILWKDFRKASNKQKFILLISWILIFIGLYKGVAYLLENSYAFVNKLNQFEEGNSSGRDSLFSFFWTAYTTDTNIFQLLFGRGADGTIKIYYNYAHNDWLEILTNQGFLGIVVFTYFWVQFYKDWKRIPSKTAVSQSLGLILLIYFSRTLFSMSYSDMSLYSTILIGYYCANNYFVANNYQLPQK